MYLRARQYGISYLPQEASVFRKLTVEENILAVLEAQPISWHERREKAEKLIDQLGLEHIRQNRGYALSGGERRRVEIARSLCINPTFILLDEPFSGIDPIAVLDLQKIISDLRAGESGSSSQITMSAKRCQSQTAPTSLTRAGSFALVRPSNWEVTPRYGEFIWEKVSRWYEFWVLAERKLILVTKGCADWTFVPSRFGSRHEKLRAAGFKVPRVSKFRGWPASLHQESLWNREH